MQVKGNKLIYDPTQTWEFKDDKNDLKACYLPEIPINDVEMFKELAKLPFTRVHYISKYNKANRTPRYTWAYGQVNPNEKVVVEYRGLDFESEVMPPFLADLAKLCCDISEKRFAFNPQYNSVIIGRYDEADDSIGLHTDKEFFLAHHFCANVTLGYARDFQFKDDSKTIHEIKLAHKSLFFFLGLEHALPKRAAVKPGEIRYSISFRNMKNNIGIGNSFYYCRGLLGAIDNDKKREYETKLKILQAEKITNE
jgi:alkylated DNA repair dioxygenase AlkB